MKRFRLSRRRILVIIQSCVSAGLLGFLISKVDVGRAGSVALNADKLFLIAAVLQLSAHPFLTALRWEIVARGLGGILPIPAALRFVWIGAFFSQLLPASFGGDVVRIWLYGVQCGSHRLSIHSVALERLVMVLVLLLFVLAVQPGLAARGASPSIVLSAAVVLTVILASLIMLLIFGRLLIDRDRRLPFRILAWVATDVRDLFSSIPAPPRFVRSPLRRT